MSGDLYPRPSREKIAERFPTPDLPRVVPGTVEPDPEPDPEPEPEPAGPLVNFAVHLQARMRALGWDQARLMIEAGIKTPQLAAQAVNGTGCDLGLAGKIAEAVGGYLATMIGPYHCSTCHGEPPSGYACLECGTEARAA